MAADPDRLVVGAIPILIDEWQRMPYSWDAVRRAVDRDPQPGRFLLTGSATPTTAPTHSGAGRNVTVRMHPLSLAEQRWPSRALAVPSVSLARLLSGGPGAVTGSTTVSLQDYVEEILGSGFPAIRKASGRARRAQLDGYLALGARRIAGLAARAQPHPTARRSSKPPPRRPCMAARLLGADVGAVLEGAPVGPTVPRQGSLLGAPFESLLTLSMRVYAQAAEARVAHLRTRGESTGST
jgi:hypothetical protein